MKKIILLFTIIFTITIYSSERTSFRATAVYEVKDPITISSNKNEINFEEYSEYISNSYLLSL